MSRFRWMIAGAAGIGAAAVCCGCGALTAPDAELDALLDGVQGGPASGPCAADAHPDAPNLLIDDMEDGDDRLPLVADRNGSWWVAVDFTPGAFSAPAADAQVLPESIPGGRCGSSRAIRFSGRGFDDWGANIAFAFRYDVFGLAPVDFSHHRGISFWARIGDGHDASVSVELQDEHSIPEGGLCDELGDMATLCWNGFGTSIGPLEEAWRRYDLVFDRLVQGTYGLRAEAFDSERVYTMEFGVSPQSHFDLWIDDISLFD